MYGCKRDAEVWVYNGPGKNCHCDDRRCLVPYDEVIKVFLVHTY